MHSHVQQYTRSHRSPSPRLASPRTARIATHASPRIPTPRLSTPNAARLASHASPRLPSPRLASQHRIASLSSPRSHSHRLARLHLTSTSIGSEMLACLASPCAPRLDARLASPALPRLSRSPCLASLASPRSPRLSLARLASALAFLARRACSLASATAPFATGGLAASDVLPSKSRRDADATRRTAELDFRVGWLLPV